MEEKVLYEELTPSDFILRLREAPIAYLPLGTLEWHGLHLPLGSDGLQSIGFFKQLAASVGGIVLPMLFLGPDTVKRVGSNDFYGMDFEGLKDCEPEKLTGSAYWISDDDFDILLSSILMQLKRAGFQIVTAHGHGPSTEFFSRNNAKWEKKYGLDTYTCWRENEKDGLGIQTDHAGANETSIVMALRPDLVHMENLSSDLEVWPLAVEGEDPRIHANTETGRKAISTNIERMSKILREALSQLHPCR